MIHGTTSMIQLRHNFSIVLALLLVGIHAFQINAWMMPQSLSFMSKKEWSGQYQQDKHHHKLYMGTTSLSELINGPMTSWNSIVGEADRAFRQGIQLEKSGQPRPANRALHEAATLYQCVLEGKEEEDDVVDRNKDAGDDRNISFNSFGHVTTLSFEDCRSVLGYILVKLGFLAMDSLSSANAAIRLYQMATEIDPMPSATAYHGMGRSLEAAGGNGKDLQHVEAAAVAYQKAMKICDDNKLFRPDNIFSFAVAAERLGKEEIAEKFLTKLQRSEAPISCLVDSWGYVRWHTRKVQPEQLNLYRGTRDMIKLALDHAMSLIVDEETNKYNGQALICEFGVGSGRSLRMTQELLPLDVPIHGFDTFTGLPQAWGSEPVGAYSTGGIIPIIDGDVHFHKGLFSDTIAPFLEEIDDGDDDNNNDHYLAYANIDCDLYTSTLDILESFHGRIVKGTILIFDEYICHPTWRQDEFRAWRECCKRFGWKYEYLAFSLSTKQAVVRITEA